MKTVKKGGNPKPNDDAVSFEQAIERLEGIVAAMEAAELSLDEVLQKYEEGTRLVRYCSRKLAEAEKKIELLTKKADGTIELEPFEPDAATPAADDAEGKLL